MTRRIVSTVAEVAGVACIVWALSTFSVPLAAGFVGVALIVAAWAVDGGGRRK
jgi:hypothetical protein